MAWYWWVLIIAAVVVIGYIKLRVFSKFLAKRKEREKEIPED